MGRIVDLCGEIAADVEEGPEGLELSSEARERLREDWSDEEIDDALSLVRESLFQGELVEAADSLSARLVEILGDFGDAQAFKRAESEGARLSLEYLDQLARRVDRLEEILEVFREGKPPERAGFDSLRRRLMDQGIEAEMERGREHLEEAPEDEDSD
jgi:hypothetical protein